MKLKKIRTGDITVDRKKLLKYLRENNIEFEDIARAMNRRPNTISQYLYTNRPLREIFAKRLADCLQMTYEGFCEMFEVKENE